MTDASSASLFKICQDPCSAPHGWRKAPGLRYFDMGRGCESTLIPSFDTERMWFRPVRLEDAEQVQKIFPQWEIVKHLVSDDCDSALARVLS